MNEEENKMEEILEAFLLANIIEIITQEEFDEVKEEIRKLLDRYKNLKEIEEEHRKENGELRAKLKEEEEKNEKLSCDRILIQENVYKEIKEKIENINNYINKNKLFELLEIDNIDVIHCRLKQILED